MQDNVHHHLVLKLKPLKKRYIQIILFLFLFFTLRKSCTIPKSQSLRMPLVVIKIFSGLTFNKKFFLNSILNFNLHPYEHNIMNEENQEPEKQKKSF